MKRDPLRFGPSLLKASARVARLARRTDADLIYTNSQKAHVYGGIAARMSRRPWVMHQRDILAPALRAPVAGGRDAGLRALACRRRW